MKIFKLSVFIGFIFFLNACAGTVLVKGSNPPGNSFLGVTDIYDLKFPEPHQNLADTAEICPSRPIVVYFLLDMIMLDDDPINGFSMDSFKFECTRDGYIVPGTSEYDLVPGANLPEKNEYLTTHFSNFSGTKDGSGNLWEDRLWICPTDEIKNNILPGDKCTISFPPGLKANDNLNPGMVITSTINQYNTFNFDYEDRFNVLEGSYDPLNDPPTILNISPANGTGILDGNGQPVLMPCKAGEGSCPTSGEISYPAPLPPHGKIHFELSEPAARILPWMLYNSENKVSPVELNRLILLNDSGDIFDPQTDTIGNLFPDGGFPIAAELELELFSDSLETQLYSVVEPNLMLWPATQDKTGAPLILVDPEYSVPMIQSPFGSDGIFSQIYDAPCFVDDNPDTPNFMVSSLSLKFRTSRISVSEPSDDSIIAAWSSFPLNGKIYYEPPDTTRNVDSVTINVYSSSSFTQPFPEPIIPNIPGTIDYTDRTFSSIIDVPEGLTPGGWLIKVDAGSIDGHAGYDIVNVCYYPPAVISGPDAVLSGSSTEYSAIPVDNDSPYEWIVYDVINNTSESFNGNSFTLLPEPGIGIYNIYLVNYDCEKTAGSYHILDSKIVHVYPDLDVSIYPEGIYLNPGLYPLSQTVDFSVEPTVFGNEALVYTWSIQDPEGLSSIEPWYEGSANATAQISDLTTPRKIDVLASVNIHGIMKQVSAVINVVDKINFNTGDQISLYVGGKTISITPDQAVNSWVSSDESVAKVDENGNVSPVAIGRVKVYAYASNGAWGEIDVSVFGLKLEPDNKIDLFIGEEQSLPMVNITDGVNSQYFDKCDPSILWIIPNSAIAQLQKDCSQNSTYNVAAVGKGITTLIAWKYSQDNTRLRAIQPITVRDGNSIKDVKIYDTTKEVFHTSGKFSEIENWDVATPFPGIAYLVATENVLDIYDSGDMSAPWMSFKLSVGANNGGGDLINGNMIASDSGGPCLITSIDAREGKIYIGQKGIGKNSGMLTIIDFNADVYNGKPSAEIYRSKDSYMYHGVYNGSIADRNSGLGYTPVYDDLYIVGNGVNDVDAEVVAVSQWNSNTDENNNLIPELTLEDATKYRNGGPINSKQGRLLVTYPVILEQKTAPEFLSRPNIVVDDGVVRMYYDYSEFHELNEAGKQRLSWEQFKIGCAHLDETETPKWQVDDCNFKVEGSTETFVSHSPYYPEDPAIYNFSGNDLMKYTSNIGPRSPTVLVQTKPGPEKIYHMWFLDGAKKFCRGDGLTGQMECNSSSANWGPLNGTNTDGSPDISPLDPYDPFYEPTSGLYWYHAYSNDGLNWNVENDYEFSSNLGYPQADSKLKMNPMCRGACDPNVPGDCSYQQRVRVQPLDLYIYKEVGPVEDKYHLYFDVMKDFDYNVMFHMTGNPDPINSNEWEWNTDDIMNVCGIQVPFRSKFHNPSIVKREDDIFEMYLGMYGTKLFARSLDVTLANSIFRGETETFFGSRKDLQGVVVSFIGRMVGDILRYDAIFSGYIPKIEMVCDGPCDADKLHDVTNLIYFYYFREGGIFNNWYPFNTNDDELVAVATDFGATIIEQDNQKVMDFSQDLWWKKLGLTNALNTTKVFLLKDGGFYLTHDTKVNDFLYGYYYLPFNSDNYMAEHRVGSYYIPNTYKGENGYTSVNNFFVVPKGSIRNPDKDNIIYIATEHGALIIHEYKYSSEDFITGNVSTGPATTQVIDSGSASNDITVYYNGKPWKDRIFLATDNGIMVYDGGADYVGNPQFVEPILEGVKINSLSIYPRNNGWMLLAGTENGFYLIDSNDPFPLAITLEVGMTDSNSRSSDIPSIENTVISDLVSSDTSISGTPTSFYIEPLTSTNLTLSEGKQYDNIMGIHIYNFIDGSNASNIKVNYSNENGTKNLICNDELAEECSVETNIDGIASIGIIPNGSFNVVVSTDDPLIIPTKYVTFSVSSEARQILLTEQASQNYNLIVYERPIFSINLYSTDPRDTDNVTDVEILHDQDYITYYSDSIGALNKFYPFGSRGDYVPMTFSIFNPSNETSTLDVSITEPLRGGGSIIPSENVDIRMVLVWHVSNDDDAPELLLKSDICEDENWGFGGCTQGESIFPLTAVPEPPKKGIPYLKKDGSASTIIPQNESRQFWITVHIPENTIEGTYTGQIRIDSNGLLLQRLNIRVDVKDISLLKPDDYFAGIQFDGSANLSEGGITYKNYLENLISHGVESVRANYPNLELEIAYQSQAEYPTMDLGPKSAAFYSGFAANKFLAPYYFNQPEFGNKLYDASWDVIKRAEEYGQMVPYFQSLDEDEHCTFSIDPRCTWPYISDSIALFAPVEFETLISESLGSQNIVMATKTADSMYSLGDINYTKILNISPDLLDGQRWIMWQSYTHIIDFSCRYVPGYFFLNSGWTGIYPYKYGYLPKQEGYDDYQDYGNYSAQDMVYPAYSSIGTDDMSVYPINTLQMELMREGIYDFKYAYTLKIKISESKNYAIAHNNLAQLNKIKIIEDQFSGIMAGYDYNQAVSERLQYHYDRLKIIKLIYDLKNACPQVF